MTTSKKSKADPLVAAVNIMIDGKAFEAGERITGVSKDQTDFAVSQKRVVKKSVFDALAAGVPAPDLGGEEPEAEDGDEGDEGDEGDDTSDGDAGETGGAQ